MSDVGSRFCSHMSDVSDFYDELQRILVQINKTGDKFLFPRIVLIGGQSDGKSSIFGRLVRRDFLPRGTGIVTRQPIMVNLIRTPLNDPERVKSGVPFNDWAQFENSGRIYEDFSEVTEKIQEITNRIAGNSIVNTQISLSIYSKDVPNLSLVDLPGLVEMPTTGQLDNINVQVEEMVKEYIMDKSTIILVVIPAIIDFATSKALRLAKEVDKKSERTLVVLTKLDRMEKGTDARDTLLGNRIHVKLGIVGVVNRNQEEIENDNMTIEEVEAREAEFFDAYYPDFKGKIGCIYLTQLLNQLLLASIRHKLPELTSEFRREVVKCEDRLAHFGPELEQNFNVKSEFSNLKEKFCAEYKRLTDGKAIIKNDGISPATRMTNVLHDEFSHRLDQIDHSKCLELSKIRHFIKNAVGMNAQQFISDKAFIEINEVEIESYRAPSHHCAQRIQQELLDAVDVCIVNGLFDAYPLIREQIKKVIEGLLQKYSQKTRKLINNKIDSEIAYINTHNKTFVAHYENVQQKEIVNSESSKIDESHHIEVPQVSSTKKNKKFHIFKKSEANGYAASNYDESEHDRNELNYVDKQDGLPEYPERSSMNGSDDLRNGNSSHFQETLPSDTNQSKYEFQVAQLIRSLVPNYMLIVRQSIEDQIPKLITLNLIRRIQNELGHELTSQLYDLSTDELAVLFREDESVAIKRAEINQRLAELNNAVQWIERKKIIDGGVQ